MESFFRSRYDVTGATEAVVKIARFYYVPALHLLNMQVYVTKKGWCLRAVAHDRWVDAFVRIRSFCPA